MPTSPRSPDQPQLERSPHRSGYDFIHGLERGMVFWGRVTPNEAQDSEHYHDNPCPWVVLSSAVVHAAFPLVQAAPLTSKIRPGPSFRILVTAEQRIDYVLPSDATPLTRDSLVLTEQSRAFSHARLLGNPVAKLSPAILFQIEAALKDVFGLL